jgi:hypothetical protein
MPAQIEITDLRMTPVGAQRTKAAEDQQLTPIAAGFDLVVTVRNRSESTTQYVITDVCRMDYDAARRLLSIDFSEHAAPESANSLSLPSSASYTAIEPGREAVISSRVSSKLTFLTESPEGRRAASVVRVPEDVDGIECTVAYGTEPPPQRPDLASLEPVPDPRRWGATVARSMKVRAAGRQQSS